MLRTERPRLPGVLGSSPPAPEGPREILLAIAPPPNVPAYASAGWPSWLIPAYRSGGHRPLIRLLEDER